VEAAAAEGDADVCVLVKPAERLGVSMAPYLVSLLLSLPINMHIMIYLSCEQSRFAAELEAYLKLQKEQRRRRRAAPHAFASGVGVGRFHRPPA